jgi:hypothetical protein
MAFRCGPKGRQADARPRAGFWQYRDGKLALWEGALNIWE